jgi:hypothetical protein
MDRRGEHQVKESLARLPSGNAGYSYMRQHLRPRAGAALPSRWHTAGNRRNSSAAGITAPTDPPRLSPIRLLVYFRPVIEELCELPAPENYREYLRLKPRQAAKALPADDQKLRFLMNANVQFRKRSFVRRFLPMDLA